MSRIKSYTPEHAQSVTDAAMEIDFRRNFNKAMDMNLFSVFSEIDPAIYGHGEGATFRGDIGEFQFFWRGVETTANEVYKALGDIANHVTHVERLK